MLHRICYLTGLLGWVAIATCHSNTVRAELIVTERESIGHIYAFAGAGGATDSSTFHESEYALAGAFNFNHSAGAAVDSTDLFSTGAAYTNGQLTIHDNVVQSNPHSLLLQASRSADIASLYIGGAGMAEGTVAQLFRVRFEVTDQPVAFTLTGEFDPGDITGTVGEDGRLSMYRPFTSNYAFNYSSATTLNHSGVLDVGTYELFFRMIDVVGASSTHHYSSDSSSANFNLSFSAVPEPSSAVLLGIAGLATMLRRRRV